LNFDCDCPFAQDNLVCKHMVAAAMEVSNGFLKNSWPNTRDSKTEIVDIPRQPPSVSPTTPPATNRSAWKHELDTMFYQIPSPSRAGATANRFAALLLLSKEQYYFRAGYVLRPAVIKAKNWHALETLEGRDPGEINEFLTKNLDWYPQREDWYGQLNPAGCINLSRDQFALLNSFYQYSRIYSAGSLTNFQLNLLPTMQVPLFLTGSSKKSIPQRIEVIPEQAEIEIHFSQQKDKLILAAGLKGHDIQSGKLKVELVSDSPPWLLFGNNMFPLRDASHINLFASFPISIPLSDADFFRENYLVRVAEALPLKGDLIEWQDIERNAVPRLYLRDEKGGALHAALRFGYGEMEVQAEKSPPESAVESVPGTWTLKRIRRKPEQEQQFYQLLSASETRLKRADSSQPYGTFELRARAHPFDFLMYSIPLLTKAGFEIYGEEQLKLARINRATPTLHVNITSGIDWFDLKAVVEYGEQQIPLHDLRKAIKRGEQYIKLADGSIGQIPLDWLEKYKHLWNLANETAEGFRVRDMHLPLIDELLEGDPAIQIPADLRARRERFRQFEQIAPRPVPTGFQGELRPYQQRGLEWLHFLRDYHFGGILADDMGLGKTIQVLAFLQSLREEGKPYPPSLLVVPKSLIVNWQREAEKFTPDLTFMEYVGQVRSKDTSLFDQFDVIITTYGTMLRDVAILRDYKFNTIILDESQAIKNPLSKSAKAACLLAADHRLVMTGTPVENNTFELWSQFAFLNPGFLGSMEYFKKEFATPIEAGLDEKSAVTLRKLIYPFILRRTKEQVAPELPPRTERVLYTDLDPQQKKMYAQTRERYRAELMGLIETEGFNDVRFKILEGLLRLRQIAIHPALIDKNFKGEAPKFELLLETLETLQQENHKALIFSQFVETLHLLQRELDTRNMRYAYLDGQTANRQEQVDLFQTDPTYRFFLISLKAGGVGLNLTAADYVIHLDPWWNPAVEMQASDRAHRIGQDKPVFIYKIIARDTVEEKILQLQEKKRALVKSLIANEESFFKSLSADDVKMLFE
jgi:non-specific serine/threonine protein kinase